jgi:DUF3088 family protein
MSRDIIFLLAPGFEDNNRREYCPECAEIWGVLNYFPAILHGLDIRYQPIARPRAEMVDMLGEDHQNCPTLVLAQSVDTGAEAAVKTANGHSFLDNARDIGKYFAHRYGVAVPRGS